MTENNSYLMQLIHRLLGDKFYYDSNNDICKTNSTVQLCYINNNAKISCQKN